ncbi:DNA-binding transcriptional regulator, MarR family [Streptomyces sp. DvalAA-14]|uniref:MarR family winged helix-turn-helix transcriptional regulator n=1 Tax=unclassified Streptomyces TaxID=2593676 RepID=UPI00081B5BBE|nr:MULTISPECIES: MarR family transcriptional regulator [unclassified Streptomyces]MYS20079.1 MarR family transcriptional regulator [Streptomyces sp. SID4948]SCD60372.1 DNA-binding transcriptional regulator, MarR family [Streptomyces sp. DvalAA-14]
MADNPEGISESAARAARDVRVVFSRLRRRLRGVADTDELTPSQVAALTLLGRQGAVSTSDLAAAEGVRPQSMAASLTVLDQHGLIERRPDPLDGRRQLVSLTGAGRERAEGNRQAREEWLARALHDRFTEGERRTVIEAMALLDRLAQP